MASLEEVIKRSRDKILELREIASSLNPESFQDQLIPLKDDIEKEQKDVKNFSDQFAALTSLLAQHRDEYQVLVAKLDEERKTISEFDRTKRISSCLSAGVAWSVK